MISPKHKQIQEDILALLGRHGKPMSAQEVFAGLPQYTSQEIREEVWELTVASKAHLGWDWKLELNETVRNQN